MTVMLMMTNDGDLLPYGRCVRCILVDLEITLCAGVNTQVLCRSYFRVKVKVRAELFVKSIQQTYTRKMLPYCSV